MGQLSPPLGLKTVKRQPPGLGGLEHSPLLGSQVPATWHSSRAVQVTAANVGDKRYSTVQGYDAPHRSVMLSLRFESF